MGAALRARHMAVWHREALGVSAEAKGGRVNVKLAVEQFSLVCFSNRPFSDPQLVDAVEG